MITVFVPSFRADRLTTLYESMEQSQPGSSHGVIVLDNGVDWSLAPPFRKISVPGDPFVAALAFNIGFWIVPHDDVVVIMDDVQICTPNWAARTEQLFRFWPKEYGVLTFAETTTAEIYGSVPPPLHPLGLKHVAFGSSVLIPRTILNLIGPWDETFVGYGFDDFDYGIRTWHEGYHLGIAGDVVLANEAQATGWVARLGSWDAVLERQDINARRFYEKWTGQIPANLRDIQRPRLEDHLGRARCGCLQPAWRSSSVQADPLPGGP